MLLLNKYGGLGFECQGKNLKKINVISDRHEAENVSYSQNTI